MEIEVTRSVITQLSGEAISALADECCGLLFGQRQIDHIEPARNVHPDPERNFEIDPKALIDAHRAARQGGLRLRGYYHSHPSGPAEPSATDKARATGDGMIWAIIGKGAITFWRDWEQGFEPIVTRIVEK